MTDKQEPSFGSSHIDSPREITSRNPNLDRKVIEESISESSRFGARFNELISDYLTDEQAAVIGYYLVHDRANDATRYFAEVMGPHAKWLIKKMADEYRPSVADFE